MEPIRKSAYDLYVEEVEEARRTPFHVKLYEGPRLFDRSCRFMLAGLRAEHPELSEHELLALLDERLELLARLETRRDER